MNQLPVSQEIAQRARDVSLSPAERKRYSRHLVLPEVGLEGQKKLKATRVLVIGAGGLGSPVSLYLGAAGVGTLGIVEFDRVDESNLQRQILYATAQVGAPKLDSAVQRLEELNPAGNFVSHACKIGPENIMDLIISYDIVIDGTDNFATRYLVNDACVLAHKPNVYGSIFRFDGQASVFYAPHGPCYRCLFPSPPPADQIPNCAEGGVLGVLPGQIGLIQATEALKLALGIGESLIGRLQTYDALGGNWLEFHLKKDEACSVCGKHPTITKPEEMNIHCAIPSGNTSKNATEMGNKMFNPEEGEIDEISVHDLVALRESGSPHTLIDVRTDGERAVNAISNSVHIPLNELSARMNEVPKTEKVVFYCKSGMRSAHAVALAMAEGWKNTVNLEGGILSWIEEVEPDL